MPEIKKSANYPIEATCGVCVALDVENPSPAWYDMPVRFGTRVTWAHVCAEHAESHGTAGSWALGTQINGPLS